PLRQGLRLPALPAGAAPAGGLAADRPGGDRIEGAAGGPPGGGGGGGWWGGWGGTGGGRAATSGAPTSCWGSCTLPARSAAATPWAGGPHETVVEFPLAGTPTCPRRRARARARAGPARAPASAASPGGR